MIRKTSLFGLITLLILAISLQSCKVYHKPISINEALENPNLGYVKVTFKNGDELVFEKIESNGLELSGLNRIEGQEIRTVLNQDEIAKIEEQNKKTSTFFKIIGIGVGVGSLI